MAPLVEVTDTAEVDEPSLLPLMLTVLAPEILPLVIITLVKVAALFDVMVKAPARTPPEILIPDWARAPPDRLELLVVIVLLELVTKPGTPPPVRLIFPLEVITPVTVVPTSVIAPLPP